MGESQHAEPDLSDSSIVLEIRTLTVLGTVADFWYLLLKHHEVGTSQALSDMWATIIFLLLNWWIILDGWRAEGVVEAGAVGRGRASGRIKSLTMRERSLRLKRIKSESLGEMDNLKSKMCEFSSTENGWETHFQFSSNRIWMQLVQVKWVSLCLFI